MTAWAGLPRCAAEAVPEDPGEVQLAGEAPAVGDVRDGQPGGRGVGQVLPGPLQAAFQDVAGRARSGPPEVAAELARGDAERVRDVLGAQAGVGQMPVDVLFGEQQPGARLPAATAAVAAEYGQGAHKLQYGALGRRVTGARPSEPVGQYGLQAAQQRRLVRRPRPKTSGAGTPPGRHRSANTSRGMSTSSWRIAVGNPSRYERRVSYRTRSPAPRVKQPPPWKYTARPDTSRVAKTGSSGAARQVRGLRSMTCSLPAMSASRRLRRGRCWSAWPAVRPREYGEQVRPHQGPPVVVLPQVQHVVRGGDRPGRDPGEGGGTSGYLRLLASGVGPVQPTPRRRARTRLRADGPEPPGS
ncbi:hypothetical protein SRIMM317S_01623 [Streptomyces rimosus subsp. rimosus]